MVGGAWLANKPGLTGAMVHVVADAAMTSALFMAIGCIVYRLGQAQLDDLKGVFFKMPVTMAAFVVTMAALIGVPPTCGFFSKWYLIQGAAQAGVWHFVAALLLSSLVKAIILFRIIEIGYNRVPHPAIEGNPRHPPQRSPSEHAHPHGRHGTWPNRAWPGHKHTGEHDHRQGAPRRAGPVTSWKPSIHSPRFGLS